jgi:hypothetical protein
MMEHMNQEGQLRWNDKEFKNKLWGNKTILRQPKQFDFEQLAHLISVGWKRKYLMNEFKIHPSKF